MSVDSHIVCKQCKVARFLDRFYTPDPNADTRAKMLEHAEEVQGDKFRYALLGSFLKLHQGHECVLTDEFDEERDPDEPLAEYEWETVDFWRE